MFGFFKKKQSLSDDEYANNIFINLTLIQSWVLDKRNKNLSSEDLNYIAKKIALSVGCTNNDVVHMAVLLALSNDLDAGRSLRSKVNFDPDAIDFCKKFGVHDRVKID